MFEKLRARLSIPEDPNKRRLLGYAAGAVGLAAVGGPAALAAEYAAHLNLDIVTSPHVKEADPVQDTLNQVGNSIFKLRSRLLTDPRVEKTRDGISVIPELGIRIIDKVHYSHVQGPTLYSFTIQRLGGTVGGSYELGLLYDTNTKGIREVISTSNTTGRGGGSHQIHDLNFSYHPDNTKGAGHLTNYDTRRVVRERIKEYITPHIPQPALTDFSDGVATVVQMISP